MIAGRAVWVLASARISAVRAMLVAARRAVIRRKAIAEIERQIAFPIVAVDTKKTGTTQEK